jgi:hypothetical protein
MVFRVAFSNQRERDSECNLLWREPDMHLDFTRRAGVYVPPVDDVKKE